MACVLQFFYFKGVPSGGNQFFQIPRGRLLGKRDPPRSGFGLIGSGAAAIESQTSEPTSVAGSLVAAGGDIGFSPKGGIV